MSDLEVVWSGRGSLPGASFDGWSQRGSRLLDHAPGHKDLITDKESAAMTAKLRAMEFNDRKFNSRKAGRPSTANRSTICACGRKKKTGNPKCNGCYLGRAKRA